MNFNELWLVGQYRSGGENGVANVVWEFQGIFSTKEKAISACINRNYFIAPVTIDEAISDEPEKFSDCEYPIK